MRIMTYNTLFGGYDGADDRRARIQAEIVRDSDPDILLIQELKGFLDQGARRLYELERDCQDFRVWPGIMGNKES
ncbi:endonuclease/exonuclease/phosphatase family protein, partial [Sphingobium yanoikuyae]|uniref:endonuclease/exonuclease/phosphatase family protein n=1 Tax=Sphingobium yanoikuyae TaxID=13690 RepID=UPI00243184D0